MGLFEKSFLLSKVFLFYSFTSLFYLIFLSKFTVSASVFIVGKPFYGNFISIFPVSFSFLCFGFMNEESKRLAKKRENFSNLATFTNIELA